MKILEFGMAPQAKLAGFDTLVETVISTDRALLTNHAGEDAIYVRGPAIHGRPGYFEFARFEPHASQESARAQFMDYMAQKVPSVIYPDAKAGQFIVAPASSPTWWLGGFHCMGRARTFCIQNGLEFTEHDTCPAPANATLEVQG